MGRGLLQHSNVILGTKADLNTYQIENGKLCYATDEGRFYRASAKGIGADVLALAGIVPEDSSILHAQFAASAGVLRDPGRCAVNVLRIAADVVDDETVTIGADVYEFDTDDPAGLVGVGTIRVDVVAAQTPTAATDALIAAINASGTEAVTAVDIGNNEVLIVADAVGAVALACTTDMTGVGNAWAAAAMYGGAAPATKKLVAQSRAPNATEVTMGNMHFQFDFAPTVVSVWVRVAATGLVVAWGGTFAITGNRLTLTNGTNPDFADTDLVTVVVIG